jgi:hypothetical protein
VIANLLCPSEIYRDYVNKSPGLHMVDLEGFIDKVEHGNNQSDLLADLERVLKTFLEIP